MTDNFTKIAPQNMYGPYAHGACIFVLVFPLLPFSLQSILSKNKNILLCNHSEVTNIRNLVWIQYFVLPLFQSCPKEIFRSFVPVSCPISLPAFNLEVFFILFHDIDIFE